MRSKRTRKYENGRSFFQEDILGLSSSHLAIYTPEPGLDQRDYILISIRMFFRTKPKGIAHWCEVYGAYLTRPTEKPATELSKKP